jgi:uncharacterized protein YhfF
VRRKKADFMNTATFWQQFLQQTGRDPETQYFECFHFDLSERSANHLLGLVLSGKKRATASSRYAFGADGGPKIGDFSIVTDWKGNPRCVIETTGITVLPFCEMTFDICSREGEDDTLESWRIGHRRFFTEEGRLLGYEFTEDMPVMFEDFEVIYQI